MVKMANQRADIERLTALLYTNFQELVLADDTISTQQSVQELKKFLVEDLIPQLERADDSNEVDFGAVARMLCAFQIVLQWDHYLQPCLLLCRVNEALERVMTALDGVR